MGHQQARAPNATWSWCSSSPRPRPRARPVVTVERDECRVRGSSRKEGTGEQAATYRREYERGGEQRKHGLDRLIVASGGRSSGVWLECRSRRARIRNRCSKHQCSTHGRHLDRWCCGSGGGRRRDGKVGDLFDAPSAMPATRTGAVRWSGESRMRRSDQRLVLARRFGARRRRGGARC